jgi:hypothetical protein
LWIIAFSPIVCVIQNSNITWFECLDQKCRKFTVILSDQQNKTRHEWKVSKLRIEKWNLQRLKKTITRKKEIDPIRRNTDVGAWRRQLDPLEDSHALYHQTNFQSKYQQFDTWTIHELTKEEDSLCSLLSTWKRQKVKTRTINHRFIIGEWMKGIKLLYIRIWVSGIEEAKIFCFSQKYNRNFL